MTNYNLGKIYKIVRKSDDVLIYVGSTCEPMLCRRFDKHKQEANKHINRKVYKLISDNEGWLNHQILLIKVYPCDGRDELHSEEARFIRALNPIGNRNIPMRTDKEYKIENKEKIYQKIYCCCGKNYTHTNKSQHFKSKKHINSIPVQFKLTEEMQNNRKQYIFQPLPTL